MNAIEHDAQSLVNALTARWSQLQDLLLRMELAISDSQLLESYLTDASRPLLRGVIEPSALATATLAHARRARMSATGSSCLPALASYAHAAELSLRRAQQCALEVTPSGDYAVASEHRTRRVSQRAASVLPLDELVDTAEQLGGILASSAAHLQRMEADQPQLGASLHHIIGDAARLPSLHSDGPDKSDGGSPPRHHSGANALVQSIQRRLFQWSVDCETLRIGEIEASRTLSGGGNVASNADPAASSMAPAAALERSIALNEQKIATEEERLAAARQSLSNERAFVQSLLDDVSTLESAHAAVQQRAAAAEDRLEADFQAKIRDIEVEHREGINSMIARRTDLQQAIVAARSSLCGLQSELDAEYDNHAAAKELVRLRDKQLLPTLAMIRAAQEERRDVRLAGSTRWIQDPPQSIAADDVNDPICRQWLRQQQKVPITRPMRSPSKRAAPGPAAPDAFLVLQDLDTSQFVLVNTSSSNNPSSSSWRIRSGAAEHSTGGQPMWVVERDGHVGAMELRVAPSMGVTVA